MLIYMSMVYTVYNKLLQPNVQKKQPVRLLNYCILIYILMSNIHKKGKLWLGLA